jgi:outer membrane immunogenic protein
LNHSNPNRADTIVDVSEADTPLHAPKLKGALIGGHAGYNWQLGQRSVVGFEIDYSVASFKRSQVANAHSDKNELDPEIFETRTLKSRLDGLASARARVGFLISPGLLLYGTGGPAWGHTKFVDTFQARFVNSDDPEKGDEVDVLVSRAGSNHFGWAAGAGAEWKLWDSGLMLRVEYLHYDFGSTSLGYDVTLNGNRKLDSFNMHLDKLTTDVARAGISYKF